MPDPAGEELRRVAQEINLGLTTDQAIGELSKRLPSREVDVLMRTIIIQSRAGGALSEALTGISQTLEALLCGKSSCYQNMRCISAVCKMLIFLN